MSDELGKTAKQAIMEMDADLLEFIIDIAALSTKSMTHVEIANELDKHLYMVEAGAKVIDDLRISAGQQYGATSIGHLRII